MGEARLEKSVVETPAGYPIPLGGVLVDDSTPVSDPAPVSAAPDNLPAHEARTPSEEN
jgi:hypothetical protein